MRDERKKRQWEIKERVNERKKRKWMRDKNRKSEWEIKKRKNEWEINERNRKRELKKKLTIRVKEKVNERKKRKKKSIKEKEKQKNKLIFCYFYSFSLLKTLLRGISFLLCFLGNITRIIYVPKWSSCQKYIYFFLEKYWDWVRQMYTVFNFQVDNFIFEVIHKHSPLQRKTFLEQHRN